MQDKMINGTGKKKYRSLKYMSKNMKKKEANANQCRKMLICVRIG